MACSWLNLPSVAAAIGMLYWLSILIKRLGVGLRVYRATSREYARKMENLSFLLVDDHASYRYLLRQLIESHPGWVVAAEASDGELAARLAAQYVPNVVLMDASLPAMDGITAIRSIKQIAPETRIVAFSSYRDDEFRNASMQAGADEYMLKEDLVTNRLMCVIKRLFSTPENHAALET